MKKYIGALLAAGMVFALVLGSAAALNIGNVEPLQVGTTPVGAFECDGTGVDVQVGLEDPDKLESSSVIVRNIASKCEGAYLVAFALDENEDILAKAVGTLGVDTDSTRVVDATWVGGDSGANGAQIFWGDSKPLPNPEEIEQVRIHINS